MKTTSQKLTVNQLLDIIITTCRVDEMTGKTLSYFSQLTHRKYHNINGGKLMVENSDKIISHLNTLNH